MRPSRLIRAYGRDLQASDPGSWRGRKADVSATEAGGGVRRRARVERLPRGVSSRGTSATPFDSPASVRARVNGFELRFNRLLRLSVDTLLDACYFYEWRNCWGWSLLLVGVSGFRRAAVGCLRAFHMTVLLCADSECETGGDQCYG